MSQHGRGTPQDLALARTWYDKAAAQGDSRAIAYLRMLDRQEHLQAMAPVSPARTLLAQRMSPAQPSRPAQPARAAPRCIRFSQATRETPPNELYDSLAQCITDGEFADAARLFMLAGIFSRFDAIRVADVTARDTGAVMILNTFNPLPEDPKKQFGIELNALMENADARQSYCATLRRLGYPTYFPEYMVSHSLHRITPPLRADFDAEATWTSLQASYLHCTP
jgi:hypothetical protein